MGFFDSIGGFFSDAANDVMNVVTKPISAIGNAISGGAAKVLKPVAWGRKQTTREPVTGPTTAVPPR